MTEPLNRLGRWLHDWRVTLQAQRNPVNRRVLRGTFYQCPGCHSIYRKKRDQYACIEKHAAEGWTNTPFGRGGWPKHDGSDAPFCEGCNEMTRNSLNVREEQPS